MNNTRRVTVNRTRFLHQWKVSYVIGTTPWHEYFRTWHAAIRHANTVANRTTW